MGRLKGLVVVLLFFASALQGHETLTLDGEQEYYESSGVLYFIQDSAHRFSAEEIYHKEDLELYEGKKITNLFGPFWSRLVIQNSSQETLNLAIFNPHQGIDLIDVYLYSNGKLVATHRLGDRRDQASREILSTRSMFALDAKPGERYTIIAKVYNMNVNRLEWGIEPLFDYLQEETKLLYLWGLFFGVIVMYMVFNLASYFIRKEPVFLVLVLYSLFSYLYLVSVNGVLYYVDFGLPLGLVTALAWTCSNFSILFLILFPYYFFEVRSKYPRIASLFRLLIAFYAGMILSSLYALLVDHTQFGWLILLAYLGSLVVAVVLLATGITMRIKKEFGSLYYLIAQGIVLLSIVLYTFSLLDILPGLPLYKQSVAIALALDCALFLLMQFGKSQKRQQELEQSKRALMESSRFNSIGKAIGNITHQWKLPLAQLGSSVSALEFGYRHQREGFDQNFPQDIENLKKSIDRMEATITHFTHFTHFYSAEVDHKAFYPKAVIENTITHILQSKIVDKNATISLQIDETLTIRSLEYAFSDLLLILIDNSLDAFTSKESDNSITISLTKQESKMVLRYEDNAGGIPLEPVEKAFEMFVSTKEGKSQGMGLGIAKSLVEEHLKGTISVENRDGGVCFVVEWEA